MRTNLNADSSNARLDRDRSRAERRDRGDDGKAVTGQALEQLIARLDTNMDGKLSNRERAAGASHNDSRPTTPESPGAQKTRPAVAAPDQTAPKPSPGIPEKSDRADQTPPKQESAKPAARTVDTFETIGMGEGPAVTIGKDGKFQFDRKVDDSFLPADMKQGMKAAVEKNRDLPFFKDYFSNDADRYQYLVHMANLESARGTALKNDADAQGTGGGSIGYMHLHDKFGFEDKKYGFDLNTEGWTQQEALNDPEKYTTLVMRSLAGNYQYAIGNSPYGPPPDGAKPPGSQAAAADTMSQWWVGSGNQDAGNYYLSALSAGSGVDHNTGSAYA